MFLNLYFKLFCIIMAIESTMKTKLHIINKKAFSNYLWNFERVKLKSIFKDKTLTCSHIMLIRLAIFNFDVIKNSRINVLV